MSVLKDVTEVRARLELHRELVIASTALEVAETCKDDDGLRGSVLRLLENDGSSISLIRLLPWAVTGSCGFDPHDSLLVCVLSRLWHAGAETLDDLVDGDFDGDAAGLSGGVAITAAISCLTVIPQLVLARRNLAPHLELVLSREFAGCALSAAAGQVVDLRAIPATLSWKTTMRCYAKKNGAAYARDLIMLLEHLELPYDRRTWKAFGTLFGVLQQMRNDVADYSGTEPCLAPTLYLAHVVDGLRVTGGFDVPAAAVPASLKDQDNRTSYNTKVDLIRDRLLAMWATLSSSGEYDDLVQSMIIGSASAAVLPMTA